MKKILSALAAIALLLVTFASAAGAQDEPVVGTIVSDPQTVPEAGEHTVTAIGSGFLPESDVLVGSCTSPSDELVPGVSSDEDIAASGAAISLLQHCDIAGALQATTDADGNFTLEVTAEIGPNFWLVAGTLDQSQSGGTWVPIVDAEAAPVDAETTAEEEEEDLAVTGADSSTLALVGAALLALGVVATMGARRSEI